MNKGFQIAIYLDSFAFLSEYPKKFLENSAVIYSKKDSVPEKKDIRLLVLIYRRNIFKEFVLFQVESLKNVEWNAISKLN